MSTLLSSSLCSTFLSETSLNEVLVYASDHIINSCEHVFHRFNRDDKYRVVWILTFALDFAVLYVWQGGGVGVQTAFYSFCGGKKK